ncbi:MAG: hypothetical protein ACRYFW_10000 [Janthinobacterium lividum]
MMIQVVDTLMFSGAAAAAGTVIWSSVAPQWRRIVDVATGRPDPYFAPLSQLAQAERRIAIRRWSTSTRVQPAWREVA